MPHVHATYNGVKATFLSHVSAYLCCDFRDIELKVCIFCSPDLLHFRAGNQTAREIVNINRA